MFVNIVVTNSSLFFLDLRDEFERYPGGLSVLLGTPALLPCIPPIGNPTPTLRYKIHRGSSKKYR